MHTIIFKITPSQVIKDGAYSVYKMFPLLGNCLWQNKLLQPLGPIWPLTGFVFTFLFFLLCTGYLIFYWCKKTWLKKKWFDRLQRVNRTVTCNPGLLTSCSPIFTKNTHSPHNQALGASLTSHNITESNFICCTAGTHLSLNLQNWLMLLQDFNRWSFWEKYAFYRGRW